VYSSIASFVVTVVVVMMHISPVASLFFVNTRIEGIVCFVMIGLWSALVAAISDTNNGLAVDGDGSVTFGNLYYCGWGGFLCAVMLFLSYLKSVYFIEVNEELRLRSDRLNLWFGFLVASIVLTSSAANVFDHECLATDRYGTKFCNRTILALVDGGVGAGLSLVTIGMKLSTGVAPWSVELALSTVLFLSNCFSMGLVTAEEGPGSRIGNLFYFSWLCLIFPFMLLSSTVEFVNQANQEAKGPESETIMYDHTPMTYRTHQGSDSSTGESGSYPSSYERDGSSGDQPYYAAYDSRRQSAYSYGASTKASEWRSQFNDEESSETSDDYPKKPGLQSQLSGYGSASRQSSRWSFKGYGKDHW
jgi:hypothetical protein